MRILRNIDNPQSDSDKLYKDLSDMFKNFSSTDDLKYDKNSEERVKIVKAARILLNQEIYSHSFTQI